MPPGPKRFLFKNIALAKPSGAVLINQDILVEDDRIISISHSKSAEARAATTLSAAAAAAAATARSFQATEIYDGRGKLALPGFYNLHSHVPMTLLRGYGEGLPLKKWLFERVFPFEALLTEEDCYWGSLLGIAEMLASGTVSFSDMYLLTPGIARAVRESGIKANLSHGYSTAPKSKGFSDSKAYEGTRFLIDAARADKSGRLIADAAVHAEYTFGEERFGRQIADFCRREDLRVQIHLSETKDEHEACKVKRGCTPTAFFDSCGLFDTPTIAAHGVWLEDGGSGYLRRQGRKPSPLPGEQPQAGFGHGAGDKKSLTGESGSAWARTERPATTTLTFLKKPTWLPCFRRASPETR